MIKNIIFDFGDVFINLDKPATGRVMRKYGFTGITPQLDTIFKNYEMGTISSDSFLEQTNAIFPQATTQNIIDAWNAILLDFPEERLQFLEVLAAENSYRLFLLSNTNEIHIENERRKMGERFIRFENAFEVFYLSYQMGKRKPNLDIFQQVLKENNLLPEETLFIDDTKENTDAAEQLGIKTWNLLVGKEDITQLKSRL
ncbi:MAG: HAD family phosphatase [Bacteroidota bacterium]